MKNLVNRCIDKKVDLDGHRDADHREHYIWSDFDANVVFDIVDADLDGDAETVELV